MIFLDFLLLWRIEQHFILYNKCFCRFEFGQGIISTVSALYLLKIHFMLSFIMMSSGEQFCLLSLGYSDF